MFVSVEIARSQDEEEEGPFRLRMWAAFLFVNRNAEGCDGRHRRRCEVCVVRSCPGIAWTSTAIDGSPLEWCGQLHAGQAGCAFLLSEDEGCFWRYALS